METAEEYLRGKTINPNMFKIFEPRKPMVFLEDALEAVKKAKQGKT